MLTRTIRPLLAEQYADLLAQDHRSRRVLLSSYCHTLSDLVRLDQRILTCLEGMVQLKEETEDYFRGQLQEPLTAGELFSVALFAVSTDNESLLSGCLGLAQAMPRLFPVLLSVMDWMPMQSRLWPLMLSLPASRAYAATLRHRPFPPVVFSQQDVRILIEQGRCVDYLLHYLYRSGSSLFIPAMESVFSSGHEELILQGCRAILCLRSVAGNYTDTALKQLYLLAQSKKEGIRSSAVRYLLTHPACNPHALLSGLSEEATDTRLLIQAMGWSGLADYIPSLLTYFDTPDCARLSVLSVIAITGSLPEQDGWRRKNDEDAPVTVTTESAVIPERDPEQGVVWPESKAFEIWWQARQEYFAAGLPYLCGQPATPDGLSSVLRRGYLNLRPLALMRMGQFSELAAFPATDPGTTNQ
ncbi:hypothetical protein [Citrobacter telavivensis]|uniref:hypothetical protein n=1 Tax=Citrobacter telavivensis TaxID=2653932 RepID=UPI00359D085C